MTYQFLDLANEILHQANEVPFASQSDFTNATGLHLFVKEAINDVIADIYSREDSTWPFLYTETTQVLTIGDNTYSLPATARVADWNSFYIDRVYGDADDFTSVTCTTSAFTIASGSFIDKGFAVGMKTRWQGLSANTSSDVTITVLTPTVMTVSETLTAISTPDTAFSVTNAYSSDNAQRLSLMDIGSYRSNYQEYTKNIKETTNYEKPWFVTQANDNTVIFGPGLPDATYLVRYGYFTKLTALSAYNDVPLIPEQYKRVIKAGVMVLINEFRDNVEMAAYQESKYEKIIYDMRRELIPLPDGIRYLI